MTATITDASHWTTATIDLALVHIRTAVTTLRRRPDATDTSIDHAVAEARQLETYLEHFPSACTAEALACCRELLAARPT